MVHITVERFYTGKTHTIREWLDYVGNDHLHHRLAVLLKGEKRSVLFIFMLSGCLGISAITLRVSDSILVAVLLLLQATVIVFIVTLLEISSRKQL
jgi:UDP-GlcNAc:undecaprenyl-phosphate GlcNAc-1-phosphate transferase